VREEQGGLTPFRRMGQPVVLSIKEQSL
jgi:hypothetical protein